MVGLRVNRCELDELWAFVGCKQKNVKRKDAAVTGDTYTLIALGSSSRAIISYRTGKRETENAMALAADLRERVIGLPEISTDGYHPYKLAIPDAFGSRVSHWIIAKTYSVTDLRKDAAHRYSPASVVAVAREVESGLPLHISISYVERQNLTMRMGCRRFTRLTNGFSKKLENHATAVSLHVAYYNLCRVHESLRTTPAVALGSRIGCGQSAICLTRRSRLSRLSP